MRFLRIATALLCVTALLGPSREIRDMAAALATALWVWILVSNPAKYSRFVPLGVLAGVLAMLCGIFVIFRGNVPRNDFLQFYVAAQNAGARNFYAMAASSATTQSLLQNQFPMPFVRLPFYAFLLRPLAKLEYGTAYAVWQTLSAASFVAVALLWSRRRPGVAMACAWSVPIAVALVRGQDIGFVLLLLSLALRCMDEDRLAAGGVILALCSIKWSLFLMLPLFLVRFRSLRLLSGFLGSAAVLGFASFAVAGWHWPGEYFRLLQNPALSPHIEVMPNLRGLVAGLFWQNRLEVLFVLCVAALALVTVASARSREYAMAATCAAGLLLTPHAYVYDCAILVPFLVAVSAETSGRLVRYLAVLLLTPAFALLLWSPSWHTVSQGALVALMAAMAWDQRKMAGQPPPLPVDSPSSPSQQLRVS